MIKEADLSDVSLYHSEPPAIHQDSQSLKCPQRMIGRDELNQHKKKWIVLPGPCADYGILVLLQKFS